jgi:hypothetical protein
MPTFMRLKILYPTPEYNKSGKERPAYVIKKDSFNLPKLYEILF